MMKPLRSILYVALVQSSLAGAFGSKTPPSPKAEPERINPGEKPMTEQPSKKSPAVKGQYLISFENHVSDSERAAIFAKSGVKELEKVGSTPLYLIEVPDNANLDKTLEGLRKSAGVRYVEANLKMQTFGP